MCVYVEGQADVSNHNNVKQQQAFDDAPAGQSPFPLHICVARGPVA